MIIQQEWLAWERLPAMTKECEVCGKEEAPPFVCNYCGATFCAEHRLPENHNCPSKPRIPPPYIRVKLEHKSTEALHDLEQLRERKELEDRKEYAKVRARNRRRKNLRRVRNLMLLGLLFFVTWCFVMMVDYVPPIITVISPQTKTYSINAIGLTYTINEPTSWVGYSLNDAERVTLAGNITLNLHAGRYNLTIYANDTAGNIGYSEVPFTVTDVFKSVNELIGYLRKDDLSDVEWTADYTCDAFAKDFIEMSESKGYYIFTYYALWGDELDAYEDAVNSIEVVKTYPWGTETRSYTMGIGLGHAVCRTTVDGIDVIVDPQIDMILAADNFTVLYEGEITQD